MRENAVIFESMAATLNDRKIFLQTLKNIMWGEKAVLESKLRESGLSQEVINDLYEELNCVGVIRQGYDGLGNSRFMLTSFGNEYGTAFLSVDQIKERLITLKKNFVTCQV